MDECTDPGKALEIYRGAKDEEGKLAALERIVRAVGPSLFGYLLRACRSPETAEDIYQETLIGIVKKIDSCRGSNLKSWCFRIAHRKLTDYFRKWPVEHLEPFDENALEEIISSSSEDDPVSASERDDIDRARKLLRAVPPPCRGILWSFYIRELDVKTVAALYRLKYDAARQRIKRCLLKARLLSKNVL